MLGRYTMADAPSFLYYLSVEQLAAESGQALVMLAGQATTGRNALLSEAIRTLAGAVGTMSAGSGYPRSALLHATFLVRACLLRGELEQAVAGMRVGLSLLPQVQSPRVRGYLHELRPVMARRSRSPIVRDFLDEFDTASSAM